MNDLKIRTALISVSDKDHLASLARVLEKNNVNMMASEGSRRHLEEMGISVRPLEEYSKTPEIFDGRVKSISFRIAASLLCRRDIPQDREEMERLNLSPIDLVVSNLYPFSKKVKEEAPTQDLFETIDIGGSCLIRAAAKNYNSVCVLSSPSQYEEFIEEYENKRIIGLSLRKKLSLAAWTLSARYDSTIALELQRRWDKEEMPFDIPLEDPVPLRYGENPSQRSWVVPHSLFSGLASLSPLQGRPLSYNNLLDSDCAMNLACEMTILHKNLSGTAIIKHNSPCGAALAKCQLDALKLAWASDPTSAFGGIIAFSSPVQKETALWLSDKFIEIVLAPSFDEEVRNIFKTKKNLRLIEYPVLKKDSPCEMRSISGGWLVQEKDRPVKEEFQSVTQRVFPKEKHELARFGIMVTKYLKSNAISLVASEENNFFLIGSGTGHPNRVESLKQSVKKMEDNGYSSLKDKTVLISDAFFPFADNMEYAAKSGIEYIVQPGGSIKDQEVIDYCNKQKMAMAMTGRRHFRH